jgi:hypothetical protein
MQLDTITLLKLKPNAGGAYETMSKCRNLFRAGIDPYSLRLVRSATAVNPGFFAHLPQRVAQVLKHATRKEYNAQEAEYVCDCTKANHRSAKEALGSLEGKTEEG